MNHDERSPGRRAGGGPDPGHANGDVRPTSFVWRDRTRYVGDIGRSWEERVNGKLVRCYLIQSVDKNTFELHWDAGENAWTLHRAWLRDLVA